MSHFKQVYVAAVLLFALIFVPFSNVSAPARAAEHDVSYGFVPAGIEYTVTLYSDGKVSAVSVREGSIVEDVLRASGIAVGAYDRTVPVQSAIVREGLVINVHRAVFTSETLTELKPREIEYVPNEYIPVGTEKIVVEGSDGMRTATYTVVTRNGVVVDRFMAHEIVEVAPVTKVIEYGPGGTIIADDGREIRWSHKIDAVATAYTTEGYSSKTNALGNVARPGTIAVDPKVIPMRSGVYVESRDGGGSWSYGEAVAEDTGGVIKGNIVDLYFDTRAECFSFGRRTCTVYVLV